RPTAGDGDQAHTRRRVGIGTFSVNGRRRLKENAWWSGWLQIWSAKASAEREIEVDRLPVTSVFRQLARNPQRVWVRRVLFQIHLWTGIGLGLYVFVISATGSAIVFRREITRLAWSPPTVVPNGPLMNVEAISAVAKKKYPRFDVVRVTLA